MDEYLILLPKRIEVCLLDGRVKSLIVHNRSMINSLSPSGPMTN